MKKLIFLFSIILISSVQLLNAQDIFQKHGFDKESLTLSNGRYNEFFTNDEVVQIGTVLLNTRTNKVVDFVEEGTAKVVYQSEQSSRWLSLDPLARKYPQLSPYVYCANNPIRYIDPDGKKIVDAIGNVIYTQKGGWVKNASTDAQRIQTGMLLTTTGREQWNKMVNSDNKINLNISNEANSNLGKTILLSSKDKETDKYEFRSDLVVKVTVYEKTVTENMGKGQVNEGLTDIQAIGATAGHEAEHATNQQNINDAVDNDNNLSKDQEKHDVESEPTKIGNQIREEGRMKPLEPKEVFVTSN